MNDWIEARNFENYEVSKKGEIKNSKTGRIMKTSINDRGYEQVCLRKNGKQHTVRVHRLIASSFYGIDNQELDVNHIDGDKTNNSINNLEFCTRSENIRHAFKNGLSKSNLIGVGSKCRISDSKEIMKPYSKRVRVIETGEVYSSIKECARQTGCYPTQISNCCKGLSSNHHGFHFEFVDE